MTTRTQRRVASCRSCGATGRLSARSSGVALGVTDAAHAVFLSYASQDAEAAQRICDALRAAGIEVWFDQSELRGGDAWDQRIRREIRTCTLFIPTGADIGTTFPLRGAGRDGRPYALPTLILTRGARRVAFSPDGQSLVVLRGDFNHRDFWIIDLQTGAERPLAKLPAAFVIRDFDISPDGSEIVFDRTQESSELALIDRAHLRRRPVSRSHFSSARCRHASRGRHRAHPNSHGFQLHQPCQTCHLVKPPAAPAAIRFLRTWP